MNIRMFLLIAGVCIGWSAAVAQQKFVYDEGAEKSFSLALREFAENRFDEAVEHFDVLRKQRPIHQRTTASCCMAAKAYFQLREYKLSYAIAQEFLLEYPASTYRADALYIVALNVVMFQKYQESLRYLLMASQCATDSELTDQVSRMIGSVGEQRLSLREKEIMFSNESERYPKSFLALLLAEEHARKGEQGRAQEYLRDVAGVDSSGQLARRAGLLRRRLSMTMHLKIGALLPQKEGPVKGVAGEILEGMEFALSEFAKRSPLSPQLSVEVRDTDRDSASQLQPLKELIDDRDVVAIVGPLFSNLALQFAPPATKAGIPMISPTATANGIAGSGEFIFQLHPDFSLRGKAMARYAVQNLGYIKVAVLTSSDPKSKAVADAFASEAERLGAAVVANQTYGQDTTDLREPLIAIRRAVIEGAPRISFAGKVSRELIAAMLRAGANPNVLAAAKRRNEAVEVTKLLGPHGIRIADSLHFPMIMPQDQPASLEIPATAVDGLFVSLTGGAELSVVAPQISYFNIKTQLMGSAEWYDAQSLEANRRYVNDAIFISDTFTDKSDSAYIEFERAFVLEKSKEPTKNTILGYDTMRMIAELIAGGATTRDALAMALRSVQAYSGLHATITLRYGRVNSNVSILKYHNGEITKIWEIAVQ